jgi:four helix bundle protein
MTPDQLRERFAAFAAQVDAFAAPLLASPVTRNSADQLMRSSSSAAQHHRAAGRARSHAEFTAKIGVALEEADEALAWAQHLVRCGRATLREAEPIISEAQELVSILTKSCKTARANEDDRRDLDRARRRPCRR